MVTPNLSDSYHATALNRLFHHAISHDFRSFLECAFYVLNPSQAFVPSWHLEAIAEYLNAVEQGDIQRLIINMPPRSLKSLSSTVAWSAYLLGRNPAMRVITASYSSAISIKHATDTRSLLASDWFGSAFPNFSVHAAQNEKHKFMTTQQGFRLATSVGGSLTGEGGDIIIIDDPLNPAQAMSRTGRDAANHWFDHTLSSRLNDKRTGRMLLVMQRLHEQDLSGHLLRKGGWEHLSLPAQAKQAIYVRVGAFSHLMEEGALLQPLRETQQVLDQLRLDLGSAAYNAQYLQSPLADDGMMIKKAWCAYVYDTVPDYAMTVQSWDTAIKTGAQHDYSACITLRVHEGIYYVMDCITAKVEYPALKRMIAAHAASFKPDAVLIEDKASGQSLLQDMLKEPYPIIAIMPKDDKVTRLARISSLLEAGKVLFPAAASWKDSLIDELLQFPNGTHDDGVDAFSQALYWLMQRERNAHYMRVL
jgi:predicted phage terminase large subunit-like protein